MLIYHITKNNNIEICKHSSCNINKKLHFDSFYEAISALNEEFKGKNIIESSNEKIIKYNSKINYNCGVTDHYDNFRSFREKELTRLLGKGAFVNSFFVDKGDGDLQIHEILSNGVMNVYSYETNKKITVFTPHPDRIISLYISIGEFPPEDLLEQSEYNIRKGYNEIHSERN